MMDFLRNLLATEGFHPHGYCYLWRPGLISLHVISDIAIGLAYVAIGLALAQFVRRSRGQLPFSRMFVAFGVFIAACGATHFVEVWTLWSPVYWFAGSVKVVTAGASVFTALALPPLVPLALNTLASARVSEQRRVDLEQAHRRLTELDELKMQFFANVSHELRTPLTLILGPVGEMLRQEDLPDIHRRRLETMHRNAQLLLRRVNDLLDVAKLEAGRVDLDYRRTDLAQLVQGAGAHFESVAMTRGISFSLDTPERLVAEVDPSQVERVIMNLLGNALKFTPEGGGIQCILATAERPHGSMAPVARLEVHDSGPGIPREQRELIFEPFRQGHGGADRRHGGTGLGLAIVSEIVELHHGSVRVEDSPLGGSAFLVELPLRAPEGVAVGAGVTTSRRAFEPFVTEDASPEPDRETDAGDDPERPMVLVVEDNPEMNRFVAEALGDRFRVARAYNGQQGIDQALRLLPDLIVSDLMMPGITGEDMLRELRTHADLDATPVLLLSARADDEVRVRLLRHGAQDYLTKPFAPEELQARVNNWVEMKRARDVLRRALDTTQGDVELLATQISTRNQELEVSLEATRLAFLEADAASRAKSDFVSVMSHELRTPLNGVVGYLDLLEAGVGGGLADLQQGYVHRAKRSAEHLRSLIEEILTFARTEAGAEQSATQEIDVREVVHDSVSVVAPAAAEKGLSLELRLPDEPVLVRSDPGKLRQILLNLGANAVKFTETGSVTFTLRMEPSAVVLEVADTGPGIAREDLERVFEPFWQADPSKTRTAGGTGLGLTITRRLVELLGGKVAVTSDIGAGTVFSVRLPV
jgi:signal transduction histidine kinase